MVSRVLTILVLLLHSKSIGEVFKGANIDKRILDKWLDADNDNKLIKDTLPFDKENFKLRKRHIRKALKLSNNSAPGPDGISFKAWRRLNNLAVDTLYGAFQERVAADGPDNMKDQYPDFNASRIFFLHKTASGSLPDGKDDFRLDAVRPLNVTNTDNRLLSSAIR